MTVVDVIKNTIRESDYIIRTGGDEFLIVFNNINQTQAECVWNRINMEFGNINIKENREYIVSVSHGLIEIDNKNHKSIEELVSQADEKMYIEKKAMGKKLKIIKDKVIEN